jgi:hypothetical protein
MPRPAKEPHKLELSREMELERVLTLKEAAEMTGLSIDSFRTHYKHLLLQLTPRRYGVKLRSVIKIGKPAA